MKSRTLRALAVALALCVGAVVIRAFLSVDRNPVALIRVTDAAGRPVAGALVRPEGLRTKPGPYSSGWYAWSGDGKVVPPDPVTTDAKGWVRIPYPKFVFERIETGTLCLSVDHPDFVPDRPERRVALAPPAGAPLSAWVAYAWDRLRFKSSLARADPIVLQPGAILKLLTKPAAGPGENLVLYAQASGLPTQSSNSWLHPGPGIVATRRLPAGPEILRAVEFDANGLAWFSAVTNVTVLPGQPTELVVELVRGLTVRGRLDETVPRPVSNGRIIAQIWPAGEKPQNSPPEWHAWAKIQDDGTFQIESLPPGDLELVAVCDDFVSTNGPGQFPSMHYPQKFLLGTNDLTVTIGMQRTAGLEVLVTDDQGRPLKDARVATWPNVRYGEWSATLLGNDLYSTAEFLRDAERGKPPLGFWQNRHTTFEAITDASGLALLRNLPAEASDLAVEHVGFELPAVNLGGGQLQRTIPIRPIPSTTNRITLCLQPAGHAPISHY